MRRDAQLVLVRFRDHRFVDLLRHLARRAEIVVDANLDEVRLRRRHTPDHLTRRFRCVTGDDGSGDEQARVPERRHVLRVANLEAFLPIAAQAEHRGDAVPPVHAELRQHVLARIQLRPGLHAARVADVAVRVDQAGDDRLASEIVTRRIRGNLHARARPDLLDASGPNEHHPIVNRRITRVGNDARAGECLDTAGRRWRRGGCRRRLQLCGNATHQDDCGGDGGGQRDVSSHGVE